MSSHNAVTQLQLCARASLHTFIKGFSAAFGIRAAIGILARCLEIARKKPAGLLSFSTILGEKHVVFRVEAIRLGLFIGSFSGVYHLLSLLFVWKRRQEQQQSFAPSLKYKIAPEDDMRSQIECFLAGSLAAAASVSFLTPDTRKTLALYGMARALQSIAYSADKRGVWKSLLPKVGGINLYEVFVKHIDALIFIVSSAQIMYSYVMNPTTLPLSYWKFILRTGPIPARLLEATRHSVNQNFPLPLTKLGISPEQLDTHSLLVPCSVLHSHYHTCSSFCFNVLTSTVKKTWVMYLTLNAFSYLFLGFSRFLKTPLSYLVRMGLSTARSTLFLAMFVCLYQSSICVHRKFATRDHKSVYWFAGIISSLSIFIEKKSRREELGLYVFPRAVDNVLALYNIKVWPVVEAFVYAMSIGCLVYFHEYSPTCLAPLVRSVFNRILPKNKTEAHRDGNHSEQQSIR